MCGFSAFLKTADPSPEPLNKLGFGVIGFSVLIRFRVYRA